MSSDPTVSCTITGTIAGSGPGRLVTAQPAGWPLTNPSGMSATDPGIFQTLCAADGSWMLAGLPADTPLTITTPDGTSTGTIPAGNSTISLAALQSGSAWSHNGAQ